MMNFFRKHLKVIFWITSSGFIFATFAYFGMGGDIMRGDAVAKVNNVKIPQTKFNQILNRKIESLRENAKTDITDEIMKRLRQETLQDLISEEAFYQEAQKYGITVENQELLSTIASYPAFQQEGKFSHQNYFTILRYRAHMTPQEFEEGQRRQIAIAKLRNLIVSSVKVTNIELQMEYAHRNKGNMKKWEKEREEFYKTYLQEKRAQLYNDWVKNLGSEFKIKVYLKD